MVNNKFLAILLIGGILLLATRSKKGGSTTDYERNALIGLFKINTTDSQESINKMIGILKIMNDSEINAVYRLLINEEKPQPGTPFYSQIQAISAKYNIFT